MADQPWPWLIVMLVGGLTIVDRVNKMPMVLSFLGVHYGLFTAVALARYWPPASSGSSPRNPGGPTRRGGSWRGRSSSGSRPG